MNFYQQLTGVLFLFIGLGACNSQASNVSILCTDTLTLHNAPKLSFRELKTSKDIDGRTVSMEGFFSYNLEDVALYPIESRRHQKGIWLDIDDNVAQYDSLLKKFNGKKVMVTGTIDLSINGHLNSYFGELKNIICMKGHQ
jgi:hypothetical protein